MDSTPTDSVEPSEADVVAVEVAAGYRERLSAPLSYWFIAFLFGLSIAIIMLVLGPWQALLGLILGTAAGGWIVVAYGKPVIEVLPDGTLNAGSATLPASALGTAVALDAERARALRSYEADPRAFLLLRSYIPTAVRVEIIDPADPTPYLYLSSRRPKRLAAVVNALPR
jgi:Protein of unknown function (DUF3093)